VKFGVVVFPGSNCDADCYWVIERVLRRPVRYLWHGDGEIPDVDCVILPGGFSYGDYLRAGAIARFSPIMRAVAQFAANGGLVLGICNGFQILLEAGLLPGAMRPNDSLRFRCCPTWLKVERYDTPFTCAVPRGRTLRIPIAHFEGNYYADPQQLRQLQRERQVVFRYATRDGRVVPEANPNGSLDNIAGIVNRAGNVLGMMPHPERCAEAVLGGEDGRYVFESLIAYWQQKAGDGPR